MPRLTNAQFWCGMAITVLFQIALAAGFLWHWHQLDRDILRDDRKRLTAWAKDYAERLAQQRFLDYVKNLKITLPIELINESDIKWEE